MTRQGLPLRVPHPGRRGRGPGPDFRDAIVAPPSGRLLRGDVELHVRASDFRTHGHGGDHRYDSVVLHVVFEDDAGADTRLAGGRRCPVVALAPWLRRRTREISGWLSTPQLWREPCHDAMARLGADSVLRALDDLGDQRFRAREAALVAHIEARGPGEALYRALLEALGYGGARHMTAAVADRLPWSELVTRLDATPEQAKTALAVEMLLAAARLDRPTARRWAGRPRNHPARRLAGLARLLVRQRATEGGLALPALDEAPAAIVRRWTVGGDDGALIGRSRATELLVNAVLPWAAANAARAGRPGDAEAARACFRRLPRPARYGALASLEQHLRDGDRPLPLDARRQQGLLALYKTECTQGGCGRCPLS